MKKTFLPVGFSELAIPGGAIFMVIILTLFFLLPKGREIFELKKKTDLQNTELKVLAGKLIDLQTLSEAEMAESSEILIEALPAQKDFYKSLGLLKKLASQNNVSLVAFELSPGEISTAPATFQSPVSFMAIKFSFTSSFENFRSFLENLEKSLPLSQIELIKFDLFSATSSAGINLEAWPGEMVVKTAFAPLPKTLGSVQSPLAKISSKDQTLIEKLKAYHLFIPESLLEESAVGKENPFPF